MIDTFKLRTQMYLAQNNPMYKRNLLNQTPVAQPTTPILQQNTQTPQPVMSVPKISNFNPNMLSNFIQSDNFRNNINSYFNANNNYDGVRQLASLFKPILQNTEWYSQQQRAREGISGVMGGGDAYWKQQGARVFYNSLFSR